MTRDIYSTGVYQPTSQDAMPIRWMAPESLKSGVYSEKTDVWSFGIVLWEIVTYGEMPFASFKEDQVMLLVRDGYTPHLPENCDDDIKSLMNQCWKKNPKQRIVFKEIVKTLLPLITREQTTKFEKVSFYHQELCNSHK